MNDRNVQAAFSNTLPPRHRRWLRRTAWIVLVCGLGYLLLGNLYLNTAVGPWSINRKPDKFTMQWESALTWWPGEVALWKVSMRGHVGRVVWTAQAGRAVGHISLLALAGKQVYVPRLRVSDVTGDIEKVAEEILPPTPHPGGWLLNFPSISTDSVLGGRFSGLALTGRGRAEVGFTKRLRGGPAELLESTVHFDDARLLQGKTALLQAATLDAHVAMPPLTRAQAKGAEKLSYMRMGLSVDGDTPGIAARQSDAGKLELDLQPGQGHVQGTLNLARMALQPGGALSWRMPVTINDTHGLVHRNTLVARLSVDKDLHLKADMPAQAGGVLALAADLQTTGTKIALDNPRSVLSRTSGRIAGQWQFSSLRWITGLFVQVPWLTLDGAGHVDGDITLEQGVLAPGSRLDVPEVQVQADVLGQRVTGAGSAHSRLEIGTTGGARSRVEVALSQYSVAALDDLKRPYIRGSDLQLRTDSDPDLGKARQSLQAQASFNNAQVPDLRAYNRFLPNDHLRFDGGSGILSGQLALDASGSAGNGWIHIAGRGARMQAAGLALNSDVDIQFKLQRADLKHQRYQLDGSQIAIKNVSFAQPGNARSGWWAQLALPRTQLQISGGRLALDGNLDARMKDVGFLLDLFSQDHDYPAWMVKLVDVGNARVRARVRWQQKDLVLEGIDASNERFDLMGRFKLSDQRKPQGDLYARWGVLGTALELGQGQHQFHVLGAKRWFDSQLPYLK